jgi:hypothetical protein
MISWLNFWTVLLIVAGTSFAAITAVVTVKGFGDMRAMLKGLSSQSANHQSDNKEQV